MKLIVPQIFQDPGSVDCGLASLAMLLSYYNEPKSISELKKDIHVYDDLFNAGVIPAQIGTYLLTHGFAVELKCLDPHYFLNKDKDLSQRNLESLLKERISLENRIFSGNKKSPDSTPHPRRVRRNAKYRARELNRHLEFMNAGGFLDLRYPTENDIRAELQEKRPILVNLTSRFLVAKRPWKNGHFNVIKGINKTQVHVNDPGKDWGQQTYNINDYLFAIHNHPGGSLLKVKKKA